MKKHRSLLALSMAIVLVFAVLPVLYAQDAAKININKASAEEMTQLKFVGPAYAERIVRYRTENGDFKSLEDLMKVPGIGTKTFEANKERITIE